MTIDDPLHAILKMTVPKKHVEQAHSYSTMGVCLVKGNLFYKEFD